MRPQDVVVDLLPLHNLSLDGDLVSQDDFCILNTFLARKKGHLRGVSQDGDYFSYLFIYEKSFSFLKVKEELF